MKTENWVNGMSVYFYGNDIEKWEKICKDAEDGKVPSVTIRGVEFALVRHGKWIQVGDNSYKCSRCNEISCCEGNFCIDCGARMDEEMG